MEIAVKAWREVEEIKGGTAKEHALRYHVPYPSFMNYVGRNAAGCHTLGCRPGRRPILSTGEVEIILRSISTTARRVKPRDFIDAAIALNEGLTRKQVETFYYHTYKKSALFESLRHCFSGALDGGVSSSSNPQVIAGGIDDTRRSPGSDDQKQACFLKANVISPELNCDQRGNLERICKWFQLNGDKVRKKENSEHINGAYMVRLKKKKAIWGNGRDLESPDYFRTLIKEVAGNISPWHDVSNEAIIAGYKTTNGQLTPAQPIHADTWNNGEKFGVMMLSNSSEGTICYDMEGTPRRPTPAELQVAWEDAPDILVKQIEGSESAKSHLADYGCLLFATPNRRPKPSKMDPFSLVILDGAHPHCAPGGSDYRCVLFFTLRPHTMNAEESYDGETQMTKMKFIEEMCTLLNEEGKLCTEIRTYMTAKMAEAINENMLYNSVDETLQSLTRGRWELVQKQTMEFATKVIEKSAEKKVRRTRNSAKTG